jgi:hypothetical protein
MTYEIECKAKAAKAYGGRNGELTVVMELEINDIIGAIMSEAGYEVVANALYNYSPEIAARGLIPTLLSLKIDDEKRDGIFSGKGLRLTGIEMPD